MDVTARPYRLGARIGALGALAALTALAGLAPAARAADADPSLCTVVSRSGSPSSVAVEAVSTAFSPDGARLYTLGRSGDYDDSTLTSTDASDGSVIWRVDLPHQALQVVVDPVSGTLYVTGLFAPSGYLWVVDPDDGTISATAEHVGGGFTDMVADPRGGAVYVVGFVGFAGELLAYGPDATVLRSQAFADSPSGALAYDPAADDLLVGFRSWIQRFAADTLAAGALGGPQVGTDGPTRLRVGLGRVYGLYGNRYLQVLDLGTLTGPPARDLGFGARDIAVDPERGILYAGAAPQRSGVSNFLFNVRRRDGRAAAEHPRRHRAPGLQRPPWRRHRHGGRIRGVPG